ncbi:hypothetical protein FHR33_002730 [Nonomuraea dietziae]|uniref:Uncharacterized protein n=1 Tax=Nonomuraea dietziae TaxID=65515 RepID=A0A7W5V8F2_9ACTN|nr:hypothetical protein [Nonomuraea dietziae]
MGTDAGRIAPLRGTRPLGGARPRRRARSPRRTRGHCRRPPAGRR